MIYYWLKCANSSWPQHPRPRLDSYHHYDKVPDLLDDYFLLAQIALLKQSEHVELLYILEFGCVDDFLANVDVLLL